MILRWKNKEMNYLQARGLLLARRSQRLRQAGAYSVGPVINAAGFSAYPNLLYDLQDEVEAYARGALFGGQSRSASSIASDPLYKNLVNGPIDFKSIPNINNYLAYPNALQQFANGSGHAFRVNGQTYYRHKNP